MRAESLALASALAVSCVAGAHGATIISAPEDFEARLQRNSTTGEITSEAGASGFDELRVGGQTRFRFTAVQYFLLPNIDPNTIGSVTFSNSVVPDDSANVTETTFTFNADLVALGFDTNATPDNSSAAAADYVYFGEGELDAGTGAQSGVFRINQEIQDNYLVPSENVVNGGTPLNQMTDEAGTQALTAYIQSLYAHPSFVPGSSYLILRLNPDQMPLDTATNRYNISSAETTDAGATLPTLTIEVIPEPGAISLLAIAGLGLLGRRR